MEWVDQYHKYLIVSFFALFSILGLWLVTDYGISWDEDRQRRHGIVSLDYVNEKLNLGYPKYEPETDLKTYRGRHYGVLFSATCFVLEKYFGLTDDFRSRYLMRHVFNFLLFWLGSIFFFKILNRLLDSWKWALLGSLFLLLSPRIFANAFYNSKDLVLLPCYIIATYTMIRVLETKNLKYTLLHAFATAVIINTRIVGTIIPALTFFWVFMECVQCRFHKIILKRYLAMMLVYIAISIPLTIFFWPWLWEAPLAHFIESWKAMANYSWSGKNLYWGSHIPGSDVPWHYIPSWIGITTPILYLFLFLTGFCFILNDLFKSLKTKNLYRNQEELFNLILLSLFIIPLIAVILRGSTLYNGWRQLYFIYPSMLAIGVIGLSYLFKRKARNVIIKYIAFVGLTLAIAQISFWMVVWHPHQNVYFNILAGKNRTQKFDMDYWGLSYKQAFQQLSQRYPGDTISVKTEHYPGEKNYRFLPPHYKRNLFLKYGPEKAEFFMSHISGEKEFMKWKRKEFPYVNEVFSVKVEEEPLLRVFKME